MPGFAIRTKDTSAVWFRETVDMRAVFWAAVVSRRKTPVRRRLGFLFVLPHEKMLPESKP